MPIKKESLKREFTIEQKSGKVSLPDPDPNMTPDQVMQFYSATYPELVTASCHGPVYQGESMTYSFKTTVGTKG